MARIEGTLDLRQIAEGDFKSDLDLRVVLAREGEVLGSTVVKPASYKERLIPFGLDFELPIGRRPCPPTIFVGPNVADREFFGLETFSMAVEISDTKKQPDEGEAKRGKPQKAQLNLGTLLVEPRLYLCWVFCCRTYTIRGRVVCRHWEWDPIHHRWRWCDEAVPGAKVDIYDVDCFLWWCSRDLIGSAVTAIDGTFTFTFTWCCLRFYPWLERVWTIDPDVLRRIRELMATAEIPFPPGPPPPDPDPTFLQSFLDTSASMPGKLLSSAAMNRTALPEMADIGAPVSAEALMQVLPRSPELEALHVWPWWPNWGDCAPDIVFRVTQPCNGSVNEIYTETNAQTRWDIPTSLNVTLLANNKACCIPSCRDPECPECLKLTWVHCVPTDQIGVTAGPPDLRGYSYTATRQDRPFYGALRMRGAVGWDVDYFKVQYSFNGGAFSDLPIPAFGGYGRSYWNGAAMTPVPAGDFSPGLKNGQMVIVTRRHYEDLHPAIPRFGGAVIWNDYDTLFIFDTLANLGLTPDGLYHLRFVGYATDAADNLIMSSERILPTCGQTSAEMVYIRLDNQGSNHPLPTPAHPCTIIHQCTDEPDAYIRKVCKNEGQVDEICINACDIVRLDPDDTLTIHFSVTCPTTLEDGHLEAYWMRFEYGVSQSFYIGTGTGIFMPDSTPVVGPDYANALLQGAPRPQWYGGDYKVTIRGSDFPECCAYLLRLWAWKRTSNGCNSPSLTHWNQFELTFTVLRPDLCPDVCPQEG